MSWQGGEGLAAGDEGGETGGFNFLSRFAGFAEVTDFAFI